MPEAQDSELTYEAVAERIYTDPDWDTEITEQEAKIIAGGWVGPHFFPNLWRWVEGQPVAHAILLAEADGLWDNISLNQIGWKHAGEPEPSLAAAAALWRFFSNLPTGGVLDPETVGVVKILLPPAGGWPPGSGAFGTGTGTPEPSEANR